MIASDLAAGEAGVGLEQVLRLRLLKALAAAAEEWSRRSDRKSERVAAAGMPL